MADSHKESKKGKEIKGKREFGETRKQAEEEGRMIRERPKEQKNKSCE